VQRRFVSNALLIVEQTLCDRCQLAQRDFVSHQLAKQYLTSKRFPIAASFVARRSLKLLVNIQSAHGSQQNRIDVLYI